MLCILDEILILSLVHLIHVKGNQTKLADFQDDFVQYRQQLTSLVGMHTMRLTAANRNNILKIEQNTHALVRLFIGITNKQEEEAIKLLDQEGGEDIIQMVSESIMNIGLCI